jgi:DNA-binding transcriptional LysR family regulator
VQLEVHMGLSRDLREALSKGSLDAALVRLTARESGKALWSEPVAWVAREGFEAQPGTPVPLALLPAPCVLREHALESLKRAKQPWVLRYTGSSMASVQAAVVAGVGASIIPRSSLIPGMQALARSKAFADPGRLHIGLMRRTGAQGDIIGALEKMVLESLASIPAARR